MCEMRQMNCDLSYCNGIFMPFGSPNYHASPKPLSVSENEIKKETGLVGQILQCRPKAKVTSEGTWMQGDAISCPLGDPVTSTGRAALADGPLSAEADCSEGGNLEMNSQLQCGQRRVYNKRIGLSCMVWHMTMAVVLRMLINCSCWM